MCYIALVCVAVAARAKTCANWNKLVIMKSTRTTGTPDGGHRMGVRPDCKMGWGSPDSGKYRCQALCHRVGAIQGAIQVKIEAIQVGRGPVKFPRRSAPSHSFGGVGAVWGE